MKAGDTVKHNPSGETWVLAAVDLGRGEVYPCGWPETIAKAADCVLVKSCSDAESREMLGKWVVKTGVDVRITAAKDTLAAMEGGAE